MLKSCPSARDFVAALKACGQSLNLERGKLVHAYITETGHGSNLFIENTLIDMYAKCKNFEDSHNLFMYMPDRDVVTWNALIAGSTLCDDHDLPLQIFQQMLYEGIAIDRITAILILKVYGGSLALFSALQLHSCLMENGALLNDQRIKNTLIDVYCKCGEIGRAKHVFDTSTEKSVVSWNAMITGYAQNEDYDKAMGVFQEMQSHGIQTNPTTYIGILKACCSATNLHQGKLIYFHALINDLHQEIRVASALVDMYSKCGILEDANWVFRMSSDKDVVLWSSLIGGYVLHGLCKEALELFNEMQIQGIEPNNVTYLSVLKACTTMESLEQGRRIHDQIRLKGFDLIITVGNALIDMYIGCEDLSSAKDVFDKLPQRNTVTWSVFIGGNVVHGLHDEALQLFKDMLKEGIEPSSVTLSYILKTCSSIYALAQGKIVHSFSIENSVESDVLVTNTLACMYTRCGSFDDALSMFTNPIEFDVVTWSAMIAGCADYDGALSFFTSMLEAGLMPNDITFLSLLSICRQTGLVDEAFQHFGLMTRDYGIAASSEHYNCMVDLLGRTGHITEAEMLLRTVPSVPNITVWTSLLSHCMSVGDTDLGKKCFHSMSTINGAEEPGHLLNSKRYADVGVGWIYASKHNRHP